MIRFRTGDIVSFTCEACACGGTAQRMLGTHSRLDDMLVIEGIDISPATSRRQPARTAS